VTFTLQQPLANTVVSANVGAAGILQPTSDLAISRTKFVFSFTPCQTNFADSTRIALNDVDVTSVGQLLMHANQSAVVTATWRYSFITVTASETSVKNEQRQHRCWHHRCFVRDRYCEIQRHRNERGLVQWLHQCWSIANVGLIAGVNQDQQVGCCHC
jgi:hypothetical protein